jgi:5-methylcytosine-specific restriction endonuclease McrA
MARKRMIDPGIWDSVQAMSLTPAQFKLYIYLISAADDCGRLKWTPTIYRARVYPFNDYTQEAFDKDLEHLSEIGLVIQYQVDEDKYLHHPNWKRYQKINHPTKSNLPKSPIEDDNSDDEESKSDDSFSHKKAIPNAVRRAVAEKYGVIKEGDRAIVKCYYCDNKGEAIMMNNHWVHFPNLELHHLVPEIHGGESTAENIVLACRSCNRTRGHKITDENLLITPNIIESKISKVNISKTVFAQDVTLTEEEHGKLVDKFGASMAQRLIDTLSSAKLAKGYKYKSDYHAILNWVVDKCKAEPLARAGPKGWKCPHCGASNTHTGSQCLSCKRDRDEEVKR